MKTKKKTEKIAILADEHVTHTKPKSSFSFDSLESAHESIQEESPEPNFAAIEASQVTQAEKVAANQSNTDTAGTVFNPELHAVNAEGEPSKTALGKFRKKRGVSKVSSTNKAIQEQQLSAENKAAARAAGQLAADMMVGSAVTLLGEEWIPIGEKGTAEPVKFDEHSNLRRAFGDYFEAKGISDFPPGIAISIAISSYMMPRLMAGPETKTKLAKAKIWIADKFNSVKKRSKKDATQPDRGNNRERENNTSKKASKPKS